MSKHKAVLATDAYVQVAGQEAHAKRLWHPPAFEQLRLCPCLKHKSSRAIDCARDDELMLGRSRSGGQILHWCQPSFSFCFSSSTIASNPSNRAAQSWR